MAVEEVVIVVDDGQFQCTNHPYKKNMINPGGICAFCLQDKLGKLVSSSFPITVFPSSSSSSSSPSVRSNNNNNNDSIPVQTITTHNSDYSSRRPRIPFPITQRKKNKHPDNTTVSGAGGFDFKRSKSTTTPGRSVNYDVDSESRKGFWSFLYHSKQRNSYKRKADNKPRYEITHAPPSNSSFIVVDENESPQQHGTSFGRKVSRSKSVGCGSRSFSGDFFERISTGFGDCTLRRIESQREGKAKTAGGGHHDCIKERVKCGGIFSGFLMASSSTEETDLNEKSPATVVGHLANGKNRSWGWPLASPIAYLSSSSSSSTKRGQSSVNSNKINLNATTPSLMSVRG